MCGGDIECIGHGMMMIHQGCDAPSTVIITHSHSLLVLVVLVVVTGFFLRVRQSCSEWVAVFQRALELWGSLKLLGGNSGPQK